MQRLKLQIARYCARVWHRDGFEPVFALCGDSSFPYDDDNVRLMRVEDIIDKFRIAWGVPKIRTCQAKKVTRKFDRFRTLEFKKNLVVCQNCGSYHQYNRICATCYEKVHELTNLMKSKIMAYNPYIGEKQSTNVKFEDDPRPGFDDPKRSPPADDAEASTDRTSRRRIVELGIPRPTWFKPKFIDTSIPGKQ